MPSNYTIFIPFPDIKLYVADFLRVWFGGGRDGFAFRQGSVFHNFMVLKLRKPPKEGFSTSQLQIAKNRKKGVEVSLLWMKDKDPRVYNYLPFRAYGEFIADSNAFFWHKFMKYVDAGVKQGHDATFCVDAFMLEFGVDKIQYDSLCRLYRRKNDLEKPVLENDAKRPFFLPKSFDFSRNLSAQGR